MDLILVPNDVELNNDRVDLILVPNDVELNNDRVDLILVPSDVELNNDRVELILVPNDVEFSLFSRSDGTNIGQNVIALSIPKYWHTVKLR